MHEQWTPDSLLEMMRGYQAACILGAAAELELFDLLAKWPPMKAPEVAAAMGGDPRAVTILLDALCAVGVLERKDERYSVPAETGEFLVAQGAGSVLSMLQHQMNCLRGWSKLAWIVKSGNCAVREPSVRGAVLDQEAFIGAMDNVSAPVAEKVVAESGISMLEQLLDIGGASGTWTIAWLKRFPAAKAILLDLPEVVPLAQKRLGKANLLERVKLWPGDYTRDELPAGCDLAWVSAVAHQESRQTNRGLFERVCRALRPGGKILIRDIVMAGSHVAPAAGALFAVNMLVNTAAGGTYTLDEYREDLEAAGFKEVRQVRDDPGMNSLVLAEKGSAS